MNRRKFLKLAAAGVAGTPLAGAGYGLLEAACVRVTRHTVAVPRLPPAFAGKTVALLTDLHLGEYNSLEFVRSAVSRANALRPDLVALAGDFVERGTDCIRPCVRALAELRAPLGVFAVPGNHDMTDGGRPLRRALAEFGIGDLTNSGRWVELGSGRLRVAGVDDLWWGRPDLRRALGDATARDAAILLCHNPDYAETLTDPRVGLVLSGHTHGGQIYLPGYGAPWVPSRYGEKYLHGLVRAPVAQVFVSGGLGTVALPFRVNSPPEINLLTLTPPPAGYELAGRGRCGRMEALGRPRPRRSRGKYAPCSHG